MAARGGPCPLGRGEAKAAVRRKAAVGVALGRAKNLRQILQDEIDRYPRGQLPAPTEDDWMKARVTGGTRLASLMIASFTALDAVVDAWHKNGLSDPRVDKLLESPHAKTLADFRNALSHPRSLVDPKIVQMAKGGRDVFTWTQDLLAAFEDFFVAWFAQPVP